jgi:ADP-heptose:LPS heptosyltransferase
LEDRRVLLILAAKNASVPASKILVLRFSSIGDIVLTTPVLRCLRRQNGASVHFLTKSAFASIPSANPHVERVWTFEKEVTEVLPQLKKERFDCVVDLHNNLRSLRVKWALGRPAHNFDKLNFEKWLLVNTGIDRLPDRHIVHRYMDAVRALGVSYDGQGLDYFIPPESEVDLKNIDPDLKPEQYVAFAIGATHATKRLPLLKTIDLCRKVEGTVVLLGGKAEMEAGKAIADRVGKRIIDTCGQLNLHQSASLLRQSAKVLTHDTGMMHIAAAFQKKIVSLWGNTTPRFGMYPFYPEGMNRNTTVEVSGLSCRPCSKIGYAECPKGHFRCMNEIDPAAVAARLNLV